jgi:hypothetical protein
MCVAVGQGTVIRERLTLRVKAAGLGIDEAPWTNRRDVEFSPGARFELGELAVELVHCLTLDRVVVAEPRTGETRVVARAELTPLEAMQHEQLERAVKLDDITEEMLVRARACEEALRPQLATGTLSLADARRVAKTLSVSTRTVRRWIQRYKRQGDVTAFLPALRGVRRGESFLDPAGSITHSSTRISWMRRTVVLWADRG